MWKLQRTQHRPKLTLESLWHWRKYDASSFRYVKTNTIFIHLFIIDPISFIIYKHTHTHTRKMRLDSVFIDMHSRPSILCVIDSRFRCVYITLPVSCLPGKQQHATHCCLDTKRRRRRKKKRNCETVFFFATVIFSNGDRRRNETFNKKKKKNHDVIRLLLSTSRLDLVLPSWL